jgi:predicted ATPase/class 3 adenylate cyclase
MDFDQIGGSSSIRRSLAGERRVVTILFSDVKGSTAMAEGLDPEDWAEIMNSAFDFLTTPIVRYGGTVARLMGDAVLAFFGAPSAHEDDPLRAVLAGLDIVDGIKSFRQQVSAEYDLDFNVRVGVNTGIVVVGEMGTALAGEYTAMGDAVNLAARMEQTAQPGTIQITDETYRLVAPWIEAEMLGGINIKGKKEPITTYRVIGRKAQPSRARGIAGLSSSLVGRAKEFEKLRTVLEDLMEGHGQILALIGEAGLGKTRLIEELHANLEGSSKSSIQWIEARGISYESTRPYGLFIQALRQVCNIKENDSVEVVRRKVAESFSNLNFDQQSGITRTIELLLSIHKSPAREDLPLEGEALKQEIFESMLNIWLDLASQNPLILVFDDLQWADPASVELLVHLFELIDQVPILFLCAFRPYLASEAWQMKTSAETSYPHHFVKFHLTPLDENQSGQLVDNLLAISDLPPELRVTILRKSEGNPFFLEEVVRSLIDNGVIRSDGDGLYLQANSNFEQIEIPDNLQTLLLARIDALESDARRALQLASVIGRSFLYRVLKAIADMVTDIDEQLVILQQMELIMVTASYPEVEYIFRNELTRDAAYQSILRRQKREYHRKVAEAIETLFPERTVEEAHRLAYHYHEARDLPRALKYYQIAGDQSFNLYANQEASEHYGKAIEIALRMNVPSVQLSNLYTNRGRAFELLSQFDKALENYEDLEELGHVRNDRSLELAALVPQSTIYSTPTVKFNPDVGSELSRRALELAIDLGDSQAEAKALWSLMLIETMSTGDLKKAIFYGEQGLRIARENNLSEVYTYIQHDIARPYLRTGRIKEAWNSYQSSQEFWRETNNLPMLADNLASMAEALYTIGLFDQAMEYAQEGLQISRQINSAWGQAYNMMNIGPILLELGDIGGSLDALEEAYQLSIQANFAAGVVASQIIKAWLFAMLGDLKTANQIQIVIQEFVEKYETFKPLLYLVQALQKLYEGNHQKALQILENVDREYIADSERIFNPYVFNLQVEIYLADQNYVMALETANNFLQTLKNQEIQLMVPDLINQKARALIGLNRREEAYQELLAARDMAEEQKCRRILWAILIDLAEIEVNEALAERYKQEALEIIQFISDKISDEKLRESFHALPKVQKVWQP